MLEAKNTRAPVPAGSAITALHYMGDDGGNVWKLDLGANMEKEAFVTIPQLHVDPKLPLAPKIEANQNHRFKRLRN